MLCALVWELVLFVASRVWPFYGYQSSKYKLKMCRQNVWVKPFCSDIFRFCTATNQALKCKTLSGAVVQTSIWRDFTGRIRTKKPRKRAIPWRSLPTTTPRGAVVGNDRHGYRWACIRVTHMLAQYGAVLERWRIEIYGEERFFTDYSWTKTF